MFKFHYVQMEQIQSNDDQTTQSVFKFHYVQMEQRKMKH